MPTTQASRQPRTHPTHNVAHPNIGSKGDVVRRYDHEVQGGSVVPIGRDDTLETFEARMHEAENRIIVEAVRSVLEP
jgi:folate-dependent phosphoribosylglycinamide formyltransferase PurN